MGTRCGAGVRRSRCGACDMTRGSGRGESWGCWSARVADHCAPEVAFGPGAETRSKSGQHGAAVREEDCLTAIESASRQTCMGWTRMPDRQTVCSRRIMCALCLRSVCSSTPGCSRERSQASRSRQTAGGPGTVFCSSFLSALLFHDARVSSQNATLQSNRDIGIQAGPCMHNESPTRGQ